MRLRNALTAGLLAAAPLAACSSGDGEPAAEDATEQATQADGGADDGGTEQGGDAGSTDGGGDTEAGAQAGSGSDRPESVRDDYPIPFPAGWERDLLDEIGMTETTGAQLLYPEDAYDRIVAFYDEWFESRPEEFNRAAESDGTVVYQQLGEIYYQVIIGPGYEERDETWVALQTSGGELN